MYDKLTTYYVFAYVSKFVGHPVYIYIQTYTHITHIHIKTERKSIKMFRDYL